MKSNALLNGKAGPDSKTKAGLRFVKCMHKRMWSFPNPFLAFVQFKCALDKNLWLNNFIKHKYSFLKIYPYSEFNTGNKDFAINRGTHLMTKSEKAWWSPMVTGISMKSTFWKVLCSSENITKTIPFCFLSAQILKNLTSLINIWSLHSI